MSSILHRLFRKGGRKRAAAFVDFEHWCISMQKLYGQKPDVKAWYSLIKQEYDVVDVVFFGDFSGSLKYELEQLRSVTRNIIETQNSGTKYKKDFTDFLMLDYIYRYSIHNPKIDTYILFTGDGHFTSVVNFLKTECGKEVLIHGVAGATSKKLREEATRCIEFPTAEQKRARCVQAILQHLDQLDARSNGRSWATFMKTVETVAAAEELPEEEVKQEMQTLVDEGYLSREIRYSRKKRIAVINTDWEKLEKDGLYERERADK
jgi:sulfite reductase beta subunit-like hemoprotein